jgi:RNA polymerase sigma-70 factor (ECF subfamily)
MVRMAESDGAHVDRVRAGDSDAFRELVDRYARRVFRVAYRMTGSQADADDVVQETFLRAYRRLSQFESRADFGTWLYRIAVNCAHDVLRARRTSPLPDGVPLDPGALVSTAASPERLAESGLLRDRLARALESLSAAERAAFVLRHSEGWTISEIGRALGLKTSATKHAVFRAVRKVRAALGHQLVLP